MIFPRTKPIYAFWCRPVAIFGSFLPFLLGALLLYQGGLRQLKMQASTTTSQVLLHIEQILSDVERVNSKFADMVGQSCLDILPTLQQEATKAAFVRTVNLVQDNVIYCSSLLGEVQQHIPKEAYFVGKISLMSGASWLPDHPILSLRTPVSKGAIITNVDSAHLAWILTKFSAHELRILLRVGDQFLDDSGHRFSVQSDMIDTTTFSRASLKYPFSVTVGYPKKVLSWYHLAYTHWCALLVLFVCSLGFVAVTWWWLERPRTSRQELRRAILNEEFIPYVQPIVDARTRQLCGIEVLMRWQHPRAGLLDPACFIAQAETSGLIVPMTNQMMSQVIPMLVECLPILPSPFHVAVNISAAHFDSTSLLDNCTLLLSHFSPGKVVLTLELTERELLRNDSHTLTILNRLRTMGVQIALDDFGTGHASLAYLKQFPVDIIKLDGSFVRKIGCENISRLLADNVIELGVKLGLVVIAEGVETAFQADYLTTKGVDQLQGYLFGHPISIAEWGETLTVMNNIKT